MSRDQHRDVRGGERRRRLVEDEGARLDEQSLGDLDDLPPAERQLTDRSIWGFDQSELAADLFDRGRETAVVDQPTPAIVGAEADVLGDGEMSSETQLLLHDGDAASIRFARRQGHDRLTIEEDLPAVGRERARQ